MGNSAYQGKEWTLAFVSMFDPKPKSILDIGPGQGTYYHLLNNTLPGAQWDGVEVFKPYIEQFKLADFYTNIYNEDIRNFVPSQNYDLVIAGDVLEHMEKEEAQAVVNKFLPVCRLFLISIPIVRWEQGEINGNKHEIHVKDDWTHQEVLDSFPNMRFFFAGSHIGVYVLAGALSGMA